MYVYLSVPVKMQFIILVDFVILIDLFKKNDYGAKIAIYFGKIPNK